MEILIVKISSMGDIIHTLPALTDATCILQNIHFDWVVEENFTEIPMWHPAVKQVIPVAIRRWRKNWFNKIIREERYAFKRILQHKKYDKIIDAQGLIKSAMLVTRIAKGDKHGLDFKSAREPLASLFYHQRHKVSKQKHAIKRIRYLFAHSLGYNIPTSPYDYSIINNFQWNNKKKSYFIFLHSSSCTNKLWPEKNWDKLLQLTSNNGYQIRLLWGTKSEYERSIRLSQNHINVKVLPKLSLNDIAQQLINARAIISIDTGLSHLANALQCPNLTLFGPTNPNLIGEYNNIYQQYIRAFNGNMSYIEVQCVWLKFKRMISSILE